MNHQVAGWLPDPPDQRDFSPETAEVKLITGGLADFAAQAPPPTVDISRYCSPIEDQGRLGSCTANAGVALVEYFERKSFGKHLDASRLFLYKSTRKLLHWSGDRGAYIRSTMKALATFGVCPEEYWPYSDDEETFDNDPSAFCYAFAQNYQALTYFRLDPLGSMPYETLQRVREHLAFGVPFIFGFVVYSSINQANANGGKIPFPKASERIVGGHAVMAVGYDDELVIKNADGPETKGALLIRNSWGEHWGTKGYGWLPYEYIIKEQATDFWTLTNKEFLNTAGM